LCIKLNGWNTNIVDATMTEPSKFTGEKNCTDLTDNKCTAGYC